MTVDNQPDKSKLPSVDRLLDHEYDGIVEYDNPMPSWWKRLFFATFVFSVCYIIPYHVTGKGTSVAAAYEHEIQEYRAEQAKLALAEGPVTEAGLQKLLGDPALVSSGKTKFDAICVACHQPGGIGLIGPNLTDDYWLHGTGTLVDIYNAVNEGFPALGMPAWGRQLSPTELRMVVAYVGTLRHTHAPGGKAPQGKLVK